MRRTLPDFARFLRRNLNLFLTLAIFGTMLGLAIASGYWLFYRGAYLIGGLIAVSLVWARAHIRGLDVSVIRSNDRLQVGQHAEARVSLSSRSWYTKLWLDVEDATDMPGAPARAVMTLPAHGHRNWRVSVPCARRGVFSVGPIRITSGDPFGLFRFTRTFGARRPLLVLPLPERLPYFWAPPSQLSGEGTVRRRTHYVTPNAASIRDYQPGDSYNRIHWPSTARLNRLVVKTFEMDPTSEVWLLLDLHGAVQAGAGDDSTEEYGVRIAASLAAHFLDANRMVGMLACGKETVLLDPARGPQQHNRLLEALALAGAQGTKPLQQVLLEEERRFGRHSTVIVVTPSTGEAWIASIQALVQRGARATVVLLESGSFGGESALLPFSALVAGGTLTYLVRCGDDLSMALGPNGTSSAMPPHWRAGSTSDAPRR